ISSVWILLTIDTVDPSGKNNSALSKAVENGHVDVVRLLLVSNPHAVAGSLLENAAEKGCTEIVELISNYE
ncbi:UNVERIFIED_CONTAM: hypothetical protein HDU68_008515, partial [Siphonaria sp. JEL0065]